MRCGPVLGLAVLLVSTWLSGTACKRRQSTIPGPAGEAPTTEAPDDNAWDYYAEAVELQAAANASAAQISRDTADRIAASTAGEPQLTEVRAYVAGHQAVLDKVREGLGKPCVVTLEPDPSGINVPFPTHARVREIARGFRWEGWLQQQEGDTAAALDSWHDGLVLASDYRRGGDLLRRLTTDACDGLLLEPVRQAVQSSPPDTGALATLVERLGKLRSERPPWTETLAADWRENLAHQDWLLAESLVDEEVASGFADEYGIHDIEAAIEDLRRETDLMMGEAVEGARLPLWQWPDLASPEYPGDPFLDDLVPDQAGVKAAAQVEAALLDGTLLVAALELHRARHPEYPESLAALAPGILDAVPLDPFTGEAFPYERLDGSYTLHSIGPDGEDDEEVRDSERGSGDGDVVFSPGMP